METKTLWNYHVSYWLNSVQHFEQVQAELLEELFDYLVVNLPLGAATPVTITRDPEPFVYRT